MRKDKAKANREALRKQRRAVAKARAAEEWRLKKEREEGAAEQIAPAAQRNPLLDANGNMIKAPRLSRDGRTFVVSSPVDYMYELGRNRERRGKEPLIYEQHRAAARRLAQAWQEGGEGVGLGASDFARQPARGTTPTGFSDEMLARMAAQHAQRALCEGAAWYLRSLWPVTKAVVIEGMFVSAWALKVGMEREPANGYFAAAMDKLVEFWALVDKPPEGRRAEIRVAEIVSPVLDRHGKAGSG